MNLVMHAGHVINMDMIDYIIWQVADTAKPTGSYKMVVHFHDGHEQAWTYTDKARCLDAIAKLYAKAVGYSIKEEP